MTEAVIVSTARSPFGRAFKGSLKDVRPDDLAATVIQAALDKVPALDKRLVEDIYLGLRRAVAPPRLQHGQGRRDAARPGRARRAPRSTGSARARPRRPGWPSTRSRPARATSSSRPASSACRSTSSSPGPAAQARRPANGRSSPTPRPARSASPRPTRRGTTPARTASCPTSTSPWGRPPRTSPRPTASAASGRTSGASPRRTAPRPPSGRGFFDWEITPITTPDGTVVTKDDGPRPGVTLEAVQALNPVFRQKGTVTAGNCCPLNDGAAALVVMSDTKAKELGLEPLARVVSTAATGLSPEIMGLGPVDADEPRPQAGRHVDRRHGPLRDQRGVRGPGHRVGRPDRHGLRQAQRQRRRHRHRSPLRGHRRAHHRARSSTRCASGTSSSASRRCASAAGRAWRSSSSASAEPTPLATHPLIPCDPLLQRVGARGERVCCVRGCGVCR